MHLGYIVHGSMERIARVIVGMDSSSLLGSLAGHTAVATAAVRGHDGVAIEWTSWAFLRWHRPARKWESRHQARQPDSVAALLGNLSGCCAVGLFGHVCERESMVHSSRCCAANCLLLLHSGKGHTCTGLWRQQKEWV